jgi:hypothetical protein
VFAKLTVLRWRDTINRCKKLAQRNRHCIAHSYVYENGNFKTGAIELLEVFVKGLSVAELILGKLMARTSQDCIPTDVLAFGSPSS